MPLRRWAATAVLFIAAAAGAQEPEWRYASSLNSLASVHYNHRRYAEAEKLYLEALAIFEKRGREVDAAATLGNLATLRAARRRRFTLARWPFSNRRVRAARRSLR